MITVFVVLRLDCEYRSYHSCDVDSILSDSLNFRGTGKRTSENSNGLVKAGQ